MTAVFFIFLVFVINYTTIFCIVFYLHKDRSHNVVTLSPILRHMCAFWLWLTTGINGYSFSKIHYDHHSFPDTEKDVHSVKRYGFWRILFFGLFYYFQREEKLLKSEMDPKVYGEYSNLEKNFYFKYRKLGLLLFFIVLTTLYGVYGVYIYLITIFCSMFLFANIFNALSHTFGYVNINKQNVNDTLETSRNIFPIGIFLLGEELHSNHHLNPKLLNYRKRWFEFDFGYMLILFLKNIKALKVNVK